MTIRFLILILLGVFIKAQTPLISINGKQTTLEDFENTQRVNLQQFGVQKSLELFSEFQLINQYAIDEGAEQDLAFLQPYQKALIELKNENLIDPEKLNLALEEYYQKLAVEYKVQILIAEKGKKDEIQNDISAGKNFEILINQYSITKEYEQPKYIEYYKIDDQFLKILQNLPIGSISEPVLLGEDNFVWIKKDSQRPNLGLVRLQQFANPDQSVAKQVRNQVTSGGDFTKLIAQKSTVSKGDKGVLPDVITGIPDPVYNAVKNLKVGDYSQVFPYQDEYYVIRLLRHVPMKTIQEKREVLLPIFQSTDQYWALYEENLNKVDTVKTFKMYPENIDETINNGANWYQNKNYSSHKKPLYTLGNYTLTQEDILNKIKESKADSITVTIVDTAIGDDLMDAKKFYYENILIYQEPRMRPLIDSLKNTLLINYAFDNLILKRSYSDEEGMQEYINEHPEKFTIGPRADLVNYSCVNKSVAEEVKKMVENGSSSEAIIKSYDGKLDSKNRPFVVVQKGKVTENSSDLPAGVPFKKGIYITSEDDGRYFVSNISQIIPKQMMTASEVRSQFFEQYQSIYYKRTLDRLKSNADIVYNPKAVKELETKYGK